MNKKDKEKLIVGIVIGAVVSFVLISSVVVAFFIAVLFGGEKTYRTDLEYYDEMVNDCEYMNCGFITFPEQIDDNMINAEFYFSSQDTFNAPASEVILECEYDDAAYEKEVERLENIKKQYGNEVRTIIKYDGDKFQYPAYVAMEAYNNGYEYALLTENNKIVYIYTMYKTSDQLEKIDLKYLPSDYDTSQQENEPGEGYSIYLEKVDMYDGEVLGWSYDYSRNETVEVLTYHPLTVGYNHFTVCTYLDNEGNEIIKYSAYVYYKDVADSLYGLPQEIQYNELSGMPYKDASLDETKENALITYYENGVEKTKIYAIPQM